jgi:hypothetical protein
MVGFSSSRTSDQKAQAEESSSVGVDTAGRRDHLDFGGATQPPELTTKGDIGPAL